VQFAKQLGVLAQPVQRSAPGIERGLPDRPGLGVTVDEKQLTFVEAFTTAAPGPTYRRPDGSLSHW
jgi:hypothetical protein